jgi:hypothetical protein
MKEQKARISTRNKIYILMFFSMIVLRAFSDRLSAADSSTAKILILTLTIVALHFATVEKN